MRLVEMNIMNYRQFEKADISFDNGITVLAGANNSGKTSLITLIKMYLMMKKVHTANQISLQKICRNG